MGRNIGDCMLTALTVLETLGTSTSYAVFGKVEGISNKNAVNYLRRATDWGLVTMEGEPYHRKYTVVPGWQEKIKNLHVKRPCFNERSMDEIQAVRAAAQFPLQLIWR